DWLVKTLTAGGHPGTTPVAVTRMGGTTEQSTIRSTLSRLTAEMKAADAKGHNVTSPALFMMGPGVARQADLSWYESKPLFGWRALVPRSKEQAASLSEQLRIYGAVPGWRPTSSVESPRTPQQWLRSCC